ncbi:hypothetical protein JTF04_11645 [Mammaliicoccus vitulinus]|uniref:hypothetical protein n=1 Tax=Mammaliicoccus vitulinus TaxID=71237 RepID=UPI001952051A|nr:hypothetical protein [Mammaliicoccus vitulinus]MBM6630340.1 hypothetical protein [Mammaliicoccus vitulinus]
MKIVYLFDGTPFLAELNNEGEYVYPNDEWTEVPPPEGIYQPFYYNGNEWIGATREEWERNQEEIDHEPSNAEIELARTQMELFKAQVSIEELRQDNANIIKEIVLLKGGN